MARQIQRLIELTLQSRGSLAGSALFSLVNECSGPGQQLSKLILIDQKIKNGGERAQREHQIPHE
jgi:hypothetical protein